MTIRRAVPAEAEVCWNIRNQAIRHGCKNSYGDAIITAWTPENMPASYRGAIIDNPFFVVEGPDKKPVATGFLDLASGRVDAVFTLPPFTGKGLGGEIIDAIKCEARKRGFAQLTLSSTPNAQSFYEKHGFRMVRESMHTSPLAQAELRCIEMVINLS